MIKVHFITSRPSLENDIETLRSIVKIIHDRQGLLALDWIEVAYRRQVELKRDAADWTSIYKENLGAIAQSDVVIAETTHENLAVGYQIAEAIHQKKPVLLLRHKSADKNAFVTGIEDGWAQHAAYDGGTVASIVEKFLESNDIQVKDMRFNFFIDRKIHNYLRWASYRTGKTKAEVVRELLKRDIEKEKY